MEATTLLYDAIAAAESEKQRLRVVLAVRPWNDEELSQYEDACVRARDAWDQLEDAASETAPS